MTSPYVPNTPNEQKEMLATIGASSMEDLFAPIPNELRLKRPLNIPPSLPEQELQRHMSGLAARNRPAGDMLCFLGGGAYDHFIPSVVDAIASRSEFYTAYTPYQAEASQGSLQAFYEYQTLMCQLTGMDVSNASLYEAGSSVAEAVLMAMNVTGRKGKIFIAESVHPEYRLTLKTYLENLNANLETLPTPGGFLDPELVKKSVDDMTVCVVVQHPNFFGGLEEVEAVSAAVRAKKALFIVAFDPVSLGVLKRPGQYEADIAVAEGQGLGTPLGYGGPYLGIMTCRKDFIRQIPGRIVGQTVDRRGKRCWALTLQTREQHIRREKATSNICTNQGLFALRTTVHLAALGPQGLRETGELCVKKSHYAAEQLTSVPGVELMFKRPFFKEFTIAIRGDVPATLAKLRSAGYAAGLPLGDWYPSLTDGIVTAVTEKRTKAEIDGLTAAMKSALTGEN